MALRHGNSQPLLIPLSQDAEPQVVRRITVHLAIADMELERAALSLLGRSAKFSVVKGSIGYAAESDVRIIDRAPDPDQRRVLDELSPPKLLFIGVEQSVDSLIEAAMAGAWAFVAESVDKKTLEDSICALVESTGSPLLRQLAGSDLGASAVLRELSTPRVGPEDERPIDNPLTSREIEILDLIARGESSKAIGGIVGLGEQTVKNYVLKILDKTGTHNRAHAAVVAARRGWLLPLESI